MAARKQRRTLEDELHEVSLALDDPRSPEATARLKAGLASARSFVVARAASVIRDRRLEGFEAQLRDGFTRFLDDPVKRDPGCKAKLATLEALDFTESLDQEPFLTGVRLVQLEPAWGPPVDTASGVRSRCLAALARLNYPDLMLLAGELLNDAQAPVRSSAADALADFGVRHGAGLLVLKLGVGDEDPLVTLACMSGLLSLAPDVATPMLRAALRGGDDDRRELAALAFGQSGRDDAADLLIEALGDAALPERREVLLRALGLHRSDKAAAHLLAFIAQGDEDDATAALTALAARRFDPGMRERAQKSVAANREVDLKAALKAAFPEAE